MLEYLIKITTNTFPPLAPAALMLAAVYGIDRFERKKYVSRGLFIGLLAAFVYAVLKRNTGFAVREYYDLGALFASILAELFLMIFITRHFFCGAGVARPSLWRAAVLFAVASWTACAAPNILLYPFEFAVGMDNIYNADFMLRASGYCFALILAIILTAALFRVASNLSEGQLMTAFALALLTLLARDSLTIVKILLGRNMIPRYPLLTSAVMWALTHENAFIYALMALSAVLSVAGIVRARGAKPTGENPAQVRKKKFLARRQVRFCISVLFGVLVSIMIVTIGVSFANRKVELSPPVELPADGGRIFIPLETLNDGDLHRFVHKVFQNGVSTDVRYIIIQKNETAYGVGLDACDVCGASGYFQRKGQVICILCDVVMNKSTIGLPGGCNPVPLRFTIESGGIVISTDDLANEASRFY